MSLKGYRSSVDRRITILLNQVPSHRPLLDEAWGEVEDMNLDERMRLSVYADALIDNLSAHIRELQEIKYRATSTSIRVVK